MKILSASIKFYVGRLFILQNVFLTNLSQHELTFYTSTLSANYSLNRRNEIDSELIASWASLLQAGPLEAALIVLACEHVAPSTRRPWSSSSGPGGVQPDVASPN